jgi:polysaccharide deacetylase 2 family uncharacterized protein YibQ
MKLFRVITGIVLATVVVIALYYFFSGYLVKEGRERVAREKERLQEKTSPVDKGEERPSFPEGKSPRAAEIKVAIIIDDIGFDLTSAKELLEIDAPLGFAVLPHSPHCGAAAKMLHGAGREILLHLPMEPRDPDKKPGPGALYRWMGEADIRRQVEENLAAVPLAAGVNNHMGSAFMEDEEKLAVVFQELKKRGLYFIDSRTTPKSKAGELARKTGIRFAARKIFIDNGQNRDTTMQNLLGHWEKKNSRLVMIGHPYPSTITALKEAVPLLKARGILIVSPTEMVEKVFSEGNNNNHE